MEDRGPCWSRARMGMLSLAVVGTAVFLWQLRHPFLRFAWAPANELVGLPLALGLPWLADVTLYRVRARWARVTAVVCAVPLLLYSVIVALGIIITGSSYKDGRDLTFDEFAEAAWMDSSVRLYRTDGGATTNLGVVIRQERKLVPGILLVRTLDSFYPCESLDIATNATGIRLHDPNADCQSFGGASRDYKLKPFLYF
jgi:hypothetical protein